MAEKLPAPTIVPIEAVKLFNEFQSQSRARGEAALKLIMGVSGGMLTLSVGAVLSANPEKIPAHLLPSLQMGLALLFFCVAASMLLMASMIVATFHMGVRWRKRLQTEGAAFEFVATWSWLRIANTTLAFLILCSFLGGVGMVARVAIGVAGSAAATTSAPSIATRLVHVAKDSVGWTQESTGTTQIGPWLDYSPVGTRYYRDAKGIIFRVYPPGVKPNAEPANPFGLGDSTKTVPPVQ